MFSIIRRNWCYFSKLQAYNTDFNKHKPNAKQKDSPASFIQQLRTRLRMHMFCPVAETDIMTPPVRQGISISGPNPTSLMPLRAGPLTSQV